MLKKRSSHELGFPREGARVRRHKHTSTRFDDAYIMYMLLVHKAKGTWCSWLSHPLSTFVQLRGVLGSIPSVSTSFCTLHEVG
jgi:hypothetical protein